MYLECNIDILTCSQCLVLPPRWHYIHHLSSFYWDLLSIFIYKFINEMCWYMILRFLASFHDFCWYRILCYRECLVFSVSFFFKFEVPKIIKPNCIAPVTSFFFSVKFLCDMIWSLIVISGENMSLLSNFLMNIMCI